MSKIKSYAKKRQFDHVNQHQENRTKKFLNADQFSPSDTSFQKCSRCQRHFAPDRLLVHEQVCRKASNRYRYNSSFHRCKAFDHGGNVNRSKTKTKSKLKTHWRERHEQFQNIVKGKITESIFDDRPFFCSRCQRKFGTEIALTKHQKGCSSATTTTKSRIRHQNDPKK